MAKTESAKLWSLNYRLVMSVLTAAAPDIAALDLEPKELFLLGQIDEHPYPAALADTLCMPKPTVTTNLKRLEAAGFVRREIDPSDLRRHRLALTASGRKAMTRGMAFLTDAFDARLERLSSAQQQELRALLETIAEPD